MLFIIAIFQDVNSCNVLVNDLTKVNISYIHENISKEESKEILERIEDVLNNVRKHTNLLVPNELNLFISENGKYFECRPCQSLRISLRYPRNVTEDGITTMAGIRHEIGHLIFNANVKNIREGTVRDTYLHLSKRKRHLEKKDLELRGERNIEDSKGAKRDKMKLEKIIKNIERIEKLDYKLKCKIEKIARKAIGSYSEFFADILDLAFLNDPEGISKHLNSKVKHNSNKTDNQKRLSIYNKQRSFNNNSKVIYYNEHLPSDDNYFIFHQVRLYLWENYFKNTKLLEERLKILDVILRAIQEDLVEEEKNHTLIYDPITNYHDINLRLINKIDKMMGRETIDKLGPIEIDISTNIPV